MINSVKSYREVGEKSTQKAIGFRIQEIINLQESRFSKLWRLKPDDRDFYISFEDVGAVRLLL